MREWFNRHAWKACVTARLPWVRIPLSPHYMNDFLIQFFANFFATLIAGVLLYFCLDKEIQDNFKKNILKKLLRNLAGDLIYNYVSIEKLLEKQTEYSGDRFTLNLFRADGLTEFYYQQPYSESKKFPYTKLLSLIKKFNENNLLLNLIFQVKTEKAQKDNKTQYLKNANKLKTDITNFLVEIEKFYKEEELVLTGFT